MLVFSPEKINADDGSPGDGRKYIVYAVLTLFFLLVMLALVDIIPVLSTDSRACAGCHEMNREYSTWQISTHSKVDCINCHMQSDWNGLANFKLKQTVWTLKHYSGLYGKGSIELKGTIVNETCLKCHSLAKVTPSGDLIIPHDRHLDEEVACITCHVGLVHRQEQPVTAKNQNYQVIVDNELLVQVKPKMYVCLRCHERKRVTTECNACHTRLELPQQHKRADWGVIHGVSAYQQVEPCLTCHTEQTEKAVIGGVCQ